MTETNDAWPAAAPEPSERDPARPLAPPAPDAGAGGGGRSRRPSWFDRTGPEDPPPGAGDRPPPVLSSVLGVVAGLLLTAGLSMFISRLRGSGLRGWGLVLCLVFEALGVALMVLSGARRSATAGVTLCALVVVPLTSLLFVDTGSPERSLGTADKATSTATGILVVAALLWGAAYFLAPARRYAFFLGAALVAVYLVGVVQISADPLTAVGERTTVSRFTPIGPSYDDTGGAITIDPSTGSFDPSNPYGDDTYVPNDPYDHGDEYPDDESTGSVDGYLSGSSSDDAGDVATELGWLSIVFGSAYLAAAWWRDRTGDRRMGTAFAAVSIPILGLAISLLSGSFGDVATALLSIAIGAAAVLVGTSADRRALSWLGALAVTGGIVALVDDGLGESTAAMGLVFCVLGLAIAVGAIALDRRNGAAPGAHDPAPPRPPDPSPVPDAVPVPADATWPPHAAAGPPAAEVVPPWTGTTFAPPRDAT